MTQLEVNDSARSTRAAAIERACVRARVAGVVVARARTSALRLARERGRAVVSSRVSAHGVVVVLLLLLIYHCGGAGDERVSERRGKVGLQCQILYACAVSA